MHQPQSPSLPAPRLHRSGASRLSKGLFPAIVFLSLCVCPTACGPGADQKDELSTIEKCEVVCEKLKGCCVLCLWGPCACEETLAKVESAGCEEEYTEYLDCELAEALCPWQSPGGAGGAEEGRCASESEDYSLCLGSESGS